MERDCTTQTVILCVHGLPFPCGWVFVCSVNPPWNWIRPFGVQRDWAMGAVEILEPNTCIRGCCHSSTIPLHLPPLSFSLSSSPFARGFHLASYDLGASDFPQFLTIPLLISMILVCFVVGCWIGTESIVYEGTLGGKRVAIKKPILSTSQDIDKFHKELQLLWWITETPLLPFWTLEA